jgi:hypothetical protein
MSEVSMPREALLAPPRINWNHIDGPLLMWGGQMHWLTVRERAALFFRITTLKEIAQGRFGVSSG